MNIKKMIKKTIVVALAVALVVGAAPIQALESVKAASYNSYETVSKITGDYDSIDSIYSEYAIVSKDDMYGIIDLSGNVISECIYMSITKLNYSDKFLAVDEEGDNYLIDEIGDTIFLGDYYDITEVGDGLFSVMEYETTDEEVNIVSKIVKLQDTELVDATTKSYMFIEMTNDGEYYIASEDGENYDLLDLEENVVCEFGPCTFVMDINNGYFLLVTMDEEFNFDFKLVKRQGESVNEIIGKDTYKDFNVVSDGQYILAQNQDDVWQLLDGEGQSTGIEYGAYEGFGQIASDLFGGMSLSDEGDSTIDIYHLDGNKIAHFEGNPEIVGEAYILNQNTEGQWRLSDFTGEEITVFEGVNSLENIALVQDEGVLKAQDEDYNIGLVSYDGTWIVEPGIAEVIGFVNQGLFAMKIDGAWEIDKLTFETKEPDETTTEEETTTPDVTTTTEETTTPDAATSIEETTTPKTVIPESTTTAKNTVTTKEVTSNQTEKMTVTAPAKAKLTKAKAGKKRVSLKIQKVKGAKGYMVQYSMKKNFKKAKTMYTTKLKLVVKKLKAGKKYYFRAKSYVLSGKTKVYAKKWSNVKQVTVK